ncbi:MAG: hypothetical protein RI907_1947 [Pseudomonadota bacterium]|jgi:nitrate/nitrite-specific signal transduction histidine kinase
MTTGGSPHLFTMFASDRATSPARRRHLQTLGGLVLATTLPWAPGHAAAAIPNVHEAINRAGRQRMLSQRMAKAWLAVGQGVNTTQAQSVLKDSIALFDRQLDELKAFAPTPAILATYVALDPVWRSYKRALLQGAPNRAQAEEVQGLDAKVLKLAHEGTMQLEAHAGKATARLVNVSGRQRMLSQRAAKIHLARVWGTATDQQLMDLKLARREFADALALLTNAPDTTPAIRDELELVQQQWVFFDNALAKGGSGAMDLLHAKEVFTSSEHILLLMDRITAQYSRLA